MPNSSKTWAEARALALQSLESMTPEEGAQIDRGIAADPDTFELTDEHFAKMKPSRMGRPPKAAHERKRSVTLRLDPDVLAAYEATGKGWQTRINEILRQAAPQPPIQANQGSSQQGVTKKALKAG